MRPFRVFVVLAALALAGCASTPPAPAKLRVNVFPGASNLPLFAAIDRGFLARQNIQIEIINTPNSTLQRAGLAKGDFEIAQAAVDNAVAMVEVATADTIIVAGGDGSMNEFMVRPEIKSFADIRGKTLVVDAPNTAYALVARKILKSNGLADGRDYKLDPVGGTPLRIRAMAEKTDNVAGMLNPPFSFGAKDKGLKSFGRAVDLIGAYQGGGFFALRSWAAKNGPLLERFLAAYIVATRLALDPANRAQSIELIATRLKQTTALATRTYDEALLQPRFGLVPDARLDLAGLKTVLALRAELQGQWGGKEPPAERYIDLGYYERALKSVAGR